MDQGRFFSVENANNTLHTLLTLQKADNDFERRSLICRIPDEVQVHSSLNFRFDVRNIHF